MWQNRKSENRNSTEQKTALMPENLFLRPRKQNKVRHEQSEELREIKLKSEETFNISTDSVL